MLSIFLYIPNANGQFRYFLFPFYQLMIAETIKPKICFELFGSKTNLNMLQKSPRS